MKLNFKNLPICNLPYTDIELCKQMMLRLYEKIPFIAELPLMEPDDNTMFRTICNVPGLITKDKKLLIEDSTTANMAKYSSYIDKAYNSCSPDYLDNFAFQAPFFPMYIEMLKRIKPEYTLVKFIGPYTIAETIFNQTTANILIDKVYRKYIVQFLALKAFWFINKVKEYSPNTKSIILFEEPQLYKFGNLKRNYEEISNDTVITMFSKLYQTIQKYGGFVGVQSFEKCNWHLILESNADLISFDAYNNPTSLNILAPKLNTFMRKGGYINWGFFPVKNEAIIKSYNVDTAYQRLVSTMEMLANEGIPLDLIYKNSTVSTQGNLSEVPILFAEKALMLTNQLAAKIPAGNQQQ